MPDDTAMLRFTHALIHKTKLFVEWDHVLFTCEDDSVEFTFDRLLKNLMHYLRRISIVLIVRQS